MKGAEDIGTKGTFGEGGSRGDNGLGKQRDWASSVNSMHMWENVESRNSDQAESKNE